MNINSPFCHKKFSLLTIFPGILALWVIFPAYGLNSIHESTYMLKENHSIHRDYAVAAGLWFEPGGNTLFFVPVSGALGITPGFELGASLRTAWGGGSGGNHFAHLVAGGKYKLRPDFTLEADLFLGLASVYNNGLSIQTHLKRSYSQRFSALLSGKVGFMDHFVDHALMAMELAFYPIINISNSISFECGIMASSQTDNFDGHHAIDLQPGLEFKLGGEGRVSTLITMGLAGPARQGDTRVKVLWHKAF